MSHHQHARKNPGPDEQEHTAQCAEQEGRTPQWHETVDLGDVRLVEPVAHRNGIANSLRLRATAHLGLERDLSARRRLELYFRKVADLVPFSVLNQCDDRSRGGR